VNAASSGATIYVCAGTYTENVTIDEPLTLDARVRPRCSNARRRRICSEFGLDRHEQRERRRLLVQWKNQPGECQFANDAVGLVIQNNIFNGYGGVGLPTYDAGNITVQKNLFENALASSEAIQIKAATVTAVATTVRFSTTFFSAATNNGGADVNFSCTNSNS